MSIAELRYQCGLGNAFATEAMAGALPIGQNSPQQAPLGLYTEQLSGTSFTAPRADNRRTWCYRILPSVACPAFVRAENRSLASAPREAGDISPNRLRWDPMPVPAEPTDFIDGLVTFATSGDCHAQRGLGMHLYAINRSMERRYFVDNDGELLILPHAGTLIFHTEMGRLSAEPGELVLIPRGIRFRVELTSETAAGYVCENYGPYFRLPELGPIGANGLANARDFEVPVAAYEDLTGSFEVVQKFLGNLWTAQYDHSPIDVVAWHGNYYPFKYSMSRFMVLNSVSFDHPDPSIFTVLTSPSEIAGVANCDLAIFPPRWQVAERTFRPPWFHRNVLSEFMGLLTGKYEVRSAGFSVGGSSLHNSMSAHGADPEQFEKASVQDLEPVYSGGSLAFMIESRYAFQPTPLAMQGGLLQKSYDDVWRGFKRHFGAAP